MTPEELQQLVVNKTDAEREYHKLLTGTKPRVFVDQNGERVEFTPANANKLYMYIQSLDTLIKGEQAAPTHNPTGPAAFFF